jgi:ribosomal protein S18 acetylase RimI-like enzyme
MEILETTDRGLLRQAFQREPVGTFYMAADLESPCFEQCRWFVEREGDTAKAVILAFSGLEVPTVLVRGDLDSLKRILEQCVSELPARCHMKLKEGQMEAFGALYGFSRVERLDVMALGTAEEPPLLDRFDVRLIERTDPLEPILAVYRDYPGNFFDPAKLEGNVYAGAWVGGTLAAIGGTHAYAPSEDVAALGDIATAGRFRGQGLCHGVTTFLCAELQRRGCGLVGLHVASANAPAIACYRKAGFERHGSIFQMLAEKR